ncbi:MAG: class II aldolase/adducin family protein [Oscillospiraceae bacterium]|nr:class II aldolase/adducin family protein [Oscillospiraceae bacterium]
MNRFNDEKLYIINTCLWLKKQGYVFGTWGNISMRLPDGNILITPSKVAYETMTPDDLVILAPDGTQLEGFRLSTSEREIHRRLMNKRPDINAVIHTHSPYAMAAAARTEGVPAISEEMCQLLGGAIPLSSRFVPSQNHVELGEVVADSIGNSNAILIRNHGPVCLGSDLEEAKVCCQVTEKSCMMYLSLLAAGNISVIEDKYVTAGRDYFLNSYGKS